MIGAFVVNTPAAPGYFFHGSTAASLPNAQMNCGETNAGSL
jgi:hypothetical protein